MKATDVIITGTGATWSTTHYAYFPKGKAAVLPLPVQSNPQPHLMPLLQEKLATTKSVHTSSTRSHYHLAPYLQMQASQHSLR
jgi:hypothetical protein